MHTDPSRPEPRLSAEERAQRRLIAFSAAGIYAGATLVGVVEDLIPGGEHFSLLPTVAAMTIALLALLAATRVPKGVLMLLGPLGAALIAVAVADTTGFGDGAVLYMWPALWTAYFFARRGTVLIVVWIGLVHAIALVAMPDHQANLARWIDVETAVLVVAVAVRVLAARNERLVERLRSEARHDALTGLLNRRGFDEHAERAVLAARRDGSPVAVVAFDLDHFKAVNDEHGHELGDRVLARLGGILGEQVRGADVAARTGGEEFVVLMPRSDAADAIALAERVRAAVAGTGPGSCRARHGVPDALRTTVSAGVSAEDGPQSLEALLRAADHALYAAKRTGRNRVVLDVEALPASTPATTELVAAG